jgi:hypothetical protein
MGPPAARVVEAVKSYWRRSRSVAPRGEAGGVDEDEHEQDVDGVGVGLGVEGGERNRWSERGGR